MISIAPVRAADAALTRARREMTARPSAAACSTAWPTRIGAPPRRDRPLETLVVGKAAQGLARATSTE